MTAIIAPKPIRPGGTIAIVAPAGPENTTKYLQEAVCLLQELGYHVYIAGSCLTSCSSYLAGESDEHRAEDLMMMFADDSIDAILCMRGGYGSNRLIPYFEKAKFKFSKYPKPFIGYSDITYLHTYFNQKHGLLTYHGPMVKELLKGEQITIDSFLAAINGDHSVILKDIPYYSHHKKPVSGVLTGGNLTMICTTLGTDNEIDTENKILFLEEVDEPLYSVDRLLMHLFNAKKLQQAKGIILGNFNVEDIPATAALLKKMLAPLNIPIAYGVESGHCRPLLTLPLGGKVTLYPNCKQIIFGNPS